ncbi:MAG: hypothetical protein EOP21_10675 [Hyphomicrobiales bacterium]|nr:MAG: hypothetical protein EOP21_10675 [Hyphomicrobiales bacterium]
MHIKGDVADGTRGGDLDASLQSAREESDQVNAIFNALLRISQIEAGARQTRFRDVDVAEVLNTVGEIYESVAEDAGLVLVNHVEAGPSCPFMEIASS